MSFHFTKVRKHSPTVQLLKHHLMIEPNWSGHHPETTGFKGDIYADSSRETFRAFDLGVNLKTTPKGDKKSYVPSSTFVNAIASTWVSKTNSCILWVSYRNGSERLHTRNTSEDRETSLNWAVNLFWGQVCRDLCSNGFQ